VWAGAFTAEAYSALARSPPPDYNETVDIVERLKEDRLLRWSAYAAVPLTWLAVALVNPYVMLFLPVFTLALWKAMSYGMIDRNDPEDELDLF
jgi:hypothetical protein